MKTIAFLLIFLTALPAVLAEEWDDPSIFGMEFEKLFNLGSGMLAATLFLLTALAYGRKKNVRLIYVSTAFLLFALKGFLTAHELFVDEIPLIDPLASFLNFAILLSFFIGVMRK